MQPSSFFEIELKSLLTKEEYDRLFNELPKKAKLINEETINTTRYRPGDVRLRHSDKTLEVVCKEGDPTKICRREVVIPLADKNQIDHFAQVFDLLQFKPDRPWEKYKLEFEHDYNGFKYILCLQNIKDFAYILEVEFISEEDTSHIHEPNLRAIISNLGLEPIEPAEFTRRIGEFMSGKKLI